MSYLCGVKRSLAHIAYIALLLCALLMPTESVRAGGVVTGKQRGELCIDRYDGHLRLLTEERQRPSVQNGRPQQRIGSSRPTRLVPSHGPKPGRSVGRWTDTPSSYLLKYDFLRLVPGRLSVWLGVASPRSYYVIALRRILC